MIRGVHTMFFSAKPEETRAFLRDVLGFPCTDVGDGWLIFDLPEAEMGCHPIEKEASGGETCSVPNGTADISFYCDDIHASVAEMKERGVVFAGDIEDHGYGLVTVFVMPGDFNVQLYQPHYSRRAQRDL
jgi:catechol 2,3-dioxygenase-like lactoylglutathione lyase family enzyme